MLTIDQFVFSTLLFVIFVPTVIFTQEYPYQLNNNDLDEQGSTSCDRNSCSPPTGDLLVGREANLSATSTCGLIIPEKYCILGDTLKRKKCHTCDSREVSRMRKNPLKYHGIENVVSKANEDYRKFWWQAENGVENVSIRLNLGAEFHLTHIIMTFQTFRPAAMLIERSSDHGLTWKTYQYFASDCGREFSFAREGQRRSLKEVICESQYSAVTPSYHGEVIFKVLPPNIPIADPYADEVQELLKMTNLRINFTKLHTLGDDVLDPRPEMRQKYYYAMMNMKVRGSCSCYGHASRCVPDDGQPAIPGMVYGKCACDHHTTGPNCKKCEPFYQDAEWQPAIGRQTNECKRCNCNNHATACHFDRNLWISSGNKSGGFCDDCNHNTQGVHCEECKATFYRDENRRIDDPYVCIPCDCDQSGTTDEGFCETKTDPSLGTVAGQCHCKENVKGRRCNECKTGFKNFSKDNPLGCEACTCNTLGTVRNQGCDPRTGECACKLNVIGRDCNSCAKNHYGLELFEDGCRPCNCDPGGSYSLQCDMRTGQCPCRRNVTGQRCDTIESGFFVPSLDAIIYEAEKADHSNNVIPMTMPVVPSEQQRWTGDGFVRVYEKSFIDFAINVPQSSRYDIIVRYQPPEPIWSQGTILIEPLAGGVVPKPGSPCEKTFEYGAQRLPFQFEAGRVYTKIGPYCFERDEKYRIKIDVGSRNGGYENSTISVDSIVLIPVFTDFEIFSDPSSERQLEDYRRNRCEEYLYTMLGYSIPDQCKRYYQSMALAMYDGAQSCYCDGTGSKSTICSPLGGKCDCQSNIVGRRCDSCALGFYQFSREGCLPCDCHSSGSENFICDINSGQCKCGPKTYGRQCDECQPGFWNYPQCERCDCNGHAEICDSKTGACRDCLDFTGGHRCEKCVKGYYGNPLKGIDIPCKPCPCPGIPESGNFHAESCQLDPMTNSPRCYCKIGYIGERCDQCDENYFVSDTPIISETGTLEINKCLPCNCSNNIDISTPGNCDRRTGACLKCLYNTEGDHCERCQKGFYGNAINKQCLECECSIEGTNRTGEACNHVTGQCNCLPAVTGTRCDKCEINHWNISSGVGCVPCGCDPQGSFNLRCSEFDGQCSCRPGHGGLKCNECQPNHWGDPRIMCYPCECDPTGSASLQCNKHDGSCNCLKGISGKKCDQCARGYLGSAPRCESCGECFENWDATIQQLRDETLRLIERARKIKQTGASGAYGKSFVTLENALIDAEILISGSNVTDADIGSVNQTIKDLQKLVELLNEKISAAEKDTEQTVQRTARANLRLDELKLLAKDLEGQNNLLRENTTKLKADDVRSGLNLSEDAARRASIADKRVEGILPDIYKSKNLRYSTEKLITSTNFDHERSMENNRGSLAMISKKIKDLEDNIPDINKMICGGRSTIDKCDYTCGGAGCSKCGDISCDAATTKAQSALNYGQDAEKKLKELREKGEEEMRNIEEARRRSDEALREAQRAYDRAVATKNNSEAMSKEIQELFSLIDEFMAAQSATPAAIRTVAENCLKIQISLTPDQILDLATKINATLKNVTNIEEILSATEFNLRKAQALELDANVTKNRADEILGMAREVLNALAIAQEAQNEAANSIKNANAQFNDAQADLDLISSETDNIGRQSEQAQGKLEELQKKLDGLRISFTKNTYAVTQASKEAGVAGDMAKMAENDVDGLEKKFEEAKRKLAQKEEASGVQKKQSDSIRTRAEKLAKDAGEKLRVLQDIEDNFTENEENLNKYATEIDQMNRDMLNYLTIIETRSVFHKTCQT
ncbi:laminin subunit beta-1-like isoform X2 [Panonychus citri]|uniref:laminin subunit beta-1-like isoform X2 n=1 Tax=Panonychus citri TaxID=50023 RepID=UPI002308075A|nr:laminin subunit beta-1-like isoform X2 [Panonychus citri]